jgi:pimeloyl-ACP methyl ester carboxylesterase
MPFFEHEGLKLHYVDVDKRSDNPSSIQLLLIHGAGSSYLAWSFQLRDLSEEYRLIAINLSGHGMSEDMKGDISLEEHYAEQVSTLVKHLGLNDFVLVGHSMGGGVAMSYVLKKDTVKPQALVLVDTSAELDIKKLGVGLAKDAIENGIRLLKNEYFEEIMDVKKAEARLLSANPGVMLRDIAVCNGFDITDQLGSIDVPTFVIVGENDDVITPAMAKELVTALPRADIAVVKDADHSPMVEQPTEFNRLLRKFLNWVSTIP